LPFDAPDIASRIPSDMKWLVAAGFACAVWAFCGALMGIGRQLMSMDATLVVHAIGAPIGAASFAWIYFNAFGSTSPLVTAAIFVGTALVLDVFIVALLIERSFAMFASPLGVWIPLALIFASTWVTGAVAAPSHRRDDERGWPHE